MNSKKPLCYINLNSKKLLTNIFFNANSNCIEISIFGHQKYKEFSSSNTQLVILYFNILNVKR